MWGGELWHGDIMSGLPARMQRKDGRCETVKKNFDKHNVVKYTYSRVNRRNV